MKKLLVIGAGGFLGSQIVELAKAHYDVYGISLNSTIALVSDKRFYLDIANQKALVEVLEKVKPNYIIHCAAISSEGGCRKELLKSFQINVSSTITVAQYCEQNNVRLIFTSSDLVFDGDNAPYQESTEINPTMEYGKQKRQAEIELNKFKNIVVARIPLLYGVSKGKRAGLLAHFIDNCKKENPQNLFIDEFRTPAFSEDITNFLVQLLNIDYEGILHLGGKERVSRYQLGKLFCQYLKLDDSLLKQIKQADINMDYRPNDTSMNSNLAYSIGFYPRKIHVALQQIYKALN